MPQKLTTTACFIQEESSGGKPEDLPPEDSSWIDEWIYSMKKTITKVE